MLDTKVTVGKGSFGQINTWSVQEEATPHVPGDLSGGLGAVSVTAARTPESIFLSQKQITSIDRNENRTVRLGTISGVITTAREQGAKVSFSHTTPLSALNVDRQAPPVGIWGSRVANRQLRDASGVRSSAVSPMSIAVSATTGDVYVTTGDGPTTGIQKYDRYGNWISTIATPSGTGNGQIVGLIGGMTLDSAGNLYVSDTATSRIQKFNSSGAFVMTMGAVGSGNGQLNIPRDITWVASTGTIWVADGNNNRVAVFNATTGAWVANYGSVGTGLGQFTLPRTIASDGGASVYVGDDSKRIQKITVATGAFVDQFGGVGTDVLSFPPGVGDFGVAVSDTTIAVIDATAFYGYRIGSYAPYPKISMPKPGLTGLGTYVAWSPLDQCWWVAQRLYQTASPGLMKIAAGAVPLPVAFEQYIALAAPAQEFRYSATVTTSVSYPAWKGNVADRVRELCSIVGVEMVAVNNAITFRNLGSIAIDLTQIQPNPPRVPDGKGTYRNVQIVNRNVSPTPIPGSLEQNYAFMDAEKYAPYQSTWLGGATIMNDNTDPAARKRYVRYFWNKGNGGIGSDTLPGGVEIGIGTNWSVLSGQTYTAEFAVRPYNNPGKRMRVMIKWPDGSLTTSADYVMSNFMKWQTIKVTGTAPTTGSATVIVTQNAGTGYSAWATGDFLDVGNWFFGPGTSSFFDGATPGAQWLGIPAKSRSIRVAPTTGDFILYDARLDGNRVFSVKAGETIKETVQTDASLVALESPMKSDELPVGYNSYFVTDGSNLPITSAEWAAYGGDLRVAINPDDPTKIDITIVGPRSNIPGVVEPYYIANSDGQNRYAQLRIGGIGLRESRETLTFATGADPVLTLTEFGPVQDSPFYPNLAAIYNRLTWLLEDASGPHVSLDLSVPTKVISAFGMAAGAIVTYGASKYRVLSATIENAWTKLTLQKYVTVADDDARWAGQTVGTEDAYWSGYSVGDNNVAPLR